MSVRRFLFSVDSTSRINDLGLLILRVGLSGSLAWLHGLGKVDRFLSGSHQFPDPLGIGTTLSLGLAAGAEFVAAILVLVGLVTRIATVPIIATMGVAFFVYHANDSLGERELALLYLVGFVVILLTGPGRFSFDAQFARRK